MIKLEAESARKHDDLPMDSVTQANPLVQPQIFYTGNLNAGYSQAIGNSHLRSISLVGDLVARSEQRRLTILGRCSMATMPAAHHSSCSGNHLSWTILLPNGSSGMGQCMGYNALRQSAAHRQDKTDNLYLLTLGYAFDATLNDRSFVGSY